MIQKEASMEAQKAMLAGYFTRLAAAPEAGRPVVYTFVPGNLVELLGVFDAVPVYPEINACSPGCASAPTGSSARQSGPGTPRTSAAT